MKKITIIGFFLLFFLNNGLLLAHEDEVIHPKITETAAKNFKFDEYLRKNLGFTNGFKTRLPSGSDKLILRWLTDGSTAEDDFPRAVNHFHDPLKEWNEAAMSDMPSLNFAFSYRTPWWDVWTPFNSAVTWATGFTSPTSSALPYDPTNYRSPNMWANARTLYYNALTATTQTTRENNFAQMFKALGQIMHLLQEVAS